MTNGIIQQVFEKWQESFLSTYTTKELIVASVEEFNQLQQELIAKIKQEFPTNEIPDKSSEIEMIPVGNINIEVSRILIGDNKE